MKNIAPSRALTRRSNQMKLIAFVVLALGIFIGMIAVAMYAVPLAAPGSQVEQALGIVNMLILGLAFLVVGVSVVLFIRAFTWKVDNNLALATGRALEGVLNDQFTFIRNVSQRKIGYVDAILVGPPGVLVFRITDVVGEYACEGPHWMKKAGHDEWYPAPTDFTKECVDDIKTVRRACVEKGMGEVDVFGMIVFTKDPPQAQVMVKNPTVPVSTIAGLANNIQTPYLALQRMDDARVEAVVRMLMGS